MFFIYCFSLSIEWCIGLFVNIKTINKAIFLSIDSDLAKFFFYKNGIGFCFTHFEVDETRGIDLIDAMARELPGFLVPRLVREVPGEEAKVVLAAGLDTA